MPCSTPNAAPALTHLQQICTPHMKHFQLLIVRSSPRHTGIPRWEQSSACSLVGPPRHASNIPSSPTVPSSALRRNSARTSVSRRLRGCVGETGLEKEGNKSHVAAESCCVHWGAGAMNRAGLLAGTWRCSGVRHRAMSGQLALGLLCFLSTRGGYAIAGSTHSSWAQNQDCYLYRQALPKTSAFLHLKSQNCKMGFFKGTRRGTTGQGGMVSNYKGDLDYI